MTWRHFYLEPLAVLFSLTYALLMWSCVIASLVPPFPVVTITNLLSVCVFFVALLLFSLQDATTHIRTCVGAASGIVTILIIWCIINCWDSDSGKSEKNGVIDIPSEEDELHPT
jgi:predicted tellurium resistance membrane protein TerC